MNTDTPDLVAALLARLDEIERLARAATPKPWAVRFFDDSHAMSATAVTVADAADDPAPDEVVALTLYQAPRVADVYDGMWDQNAAHIAAHGPLAVLGLCRAHRQIIEQYQHARHVADRLIERDCSDGLRVVQQRAVNELERVLRVLAEGYGIADARSRGTIRMEDR